MSPSAESPSPLPAQGVRVKENTPLALRPRSAQWRTGREAAQNSPKIDALSPVSTPDSEPSFTAQTSTSTSTSQQPLSLGSFSGSEAEARIRTSGNEVRSGARRRQGSLSSSTGRSSDSSSSTSKRTTSVHRPSSRHSQRQRAFSSTASFLSASHQKPFDQSGKEPDVGTAPLTSPRATARVTCSSQRTTTGDVSTALPSIPSTPTASQAGPSRSPSRLERRSSMPSNFPPRQSADQAVACSIEAPRSLGKSNPPIASWSNRGKRIREDDEAEATQQRSPSSQRARPSTRISFSGSVSSRQSSLTGSARAETSLDTLPPIDLNNRRYELVIVQESTSGCAFGSNLLSRLPCAPPLILRLRVTDAEGREVSSRSEEPFLVCQASLITEEGQPADLITPVSSPESSRTISRDARGSETTETRVRVPSASSSQRRSSRRSASSSSSTPLPTPTREVPRTAVRMLYGSLVASPQRFRRPEEEGGAIAPYFIFPELCIRSKGRYKIKVSLRRMPRTTPSSSTVIPPISEPSVTLTSVDTGVVEVFLTGDYIIPYVTDTTRFFARQGATLPLPAGDTSE